MYVGEEIKSMRVKDEDMGLSFADAIKGPDGYYIDDSGTPLPVSASDLELSLIHI